MVAWYSFVQPLVPGFTGGTPRFRLVFLLPSQLLMMPVLLGRACWQGATRTSSPRRATSLPLRCLADSPASWCFTFMLPAFLGFDFLLPMMVMMYVHHFSALLVYAASLTDSAFFQVFFFGFVAAEIGSASTNIYHLVGSHGAAVSIFQLVVHTVSNGLTGWAIHAGVKHTMQLQSTWSSTRLLVPRIALVLASCMVLMRELLVIADTAADLFIADNTREALLLKVHNAAFPCFLALGLLVSAWLIASSRRHANQEHAPKET